MHRLLSFCRDLLSSISLWTVHLILFVSLSTQFRFHDQALFFWDRDVRNTIGILFKPAAMLPHQASAAGGSHFLPLMDPDRRKEASLNLFDFFQNVARLGEGLIRKITFDVNESG